MTTEPFEDDDPDSWTEAYSANVPRVDLVGAAANGSKTWLLTKGAAGSGLLDPDTVRDLIAKASPAPEAATMTATTTTFTGSPADVMKAIHQAPTKENPVSADLTKADDAEAAADAVIGDDEPLPDADETATGATESADGAGVPTPAPGDPDDVGSPAWEAVDAARARQALQLTIALQRLVAQSAARESQEAAVNDDCDLDDVWTLEDVGSAISAIIDMLAPFAITEQAEADQGTADSMAKAAALIKAGRVLSSANEAKIRGAADALQAVLGSLPAATDDAAPVAKNGATVSETEKTPQERHDAAHELLTKASTEEGWSITKAKGDPAMAVFDASGALVGTINPSDLSPIAAPAPPDGGDATAAADDTAPAAPEDATDGPAADAVPAPAPVPPVTPVADDTTVKKEATEEISLLKSSLDTALEALRKQGERLEHLEKQPMPGGPMLNGAIPDSDGLTLRGQGDAQTDLRKAYEGESDPFKKQELRTQLALEGIRNAPPLR